MLMADDQAALTPVPMTPPPRFAPASLELIRPDGLRLRIEPGDGINAQAVLDRFLGLGG